MLAPPAGDLGPTLPGLSADDPPGRVVAAVGRDGRRRPPRQRAEWAESDGRGRPARSAAAHRRAYAIDLGGSRRALAAERRTSVPAGHPGREARRDPRRRSPEQPRATQTVQRRRPRVLPRSLPAFSLSQRSAVGQYAAEPLRKCMTARISATMPRANRIGWTIVPPAMAMTKRMIATMSHNMI